MNQTTPEKLDNGSFPQSSDVRYRLAVGTTIVAGVFSALVCVLLVADYSRRQSQDPLDSPGFQELKAQLVERPEDEHLKRQIRQLDLEWRTTYFRQRRFTEWGAWLLLAGVIVFLIAAKSAAVLREKLPMPEPLPQARDTETGMTSVARLSVAVLAVLLLGTAVALSIGIRTRLPESAEGLAAPVEPEVPDGGPDQQPAPAVAADYPTDEEIRRNWPRFRGPGGLGISHHRDVLVKWDATSGEGILWKTPVPLEGNNSPVVWLDRVFLSGATEERREVYCFDANTGELLWQKEVPGTPESTAGAPREATSPEVSQQTGYAAPTTAADGRRVYAMFANGDVAAFDFGGNLVWSRSLGIPDNAYGHASSLVVYRNLLLIQFDQGGLPKDGKSRLMALNTATGQTAYDVPRPVPNSWTTPCLTTVEGRIQLITCGDPWVIAYDPSDGSEIWRADCLSSDCGPSPVVIDGVVHVGNEYCQWSAIRADGHGDVTDSHVLWQAEDGLPDTASPVATDQYVFLLASYGILTCYDARSGEFLWEEEFDDATFTSSPSLAGDRLYLFSEEGTAWVLEPSREGCRRISESKLGEKCVTSPAFQDGRIYIRGEQHLLCIGEK